MSSTLTRGRRFGAALAAAAVAATTIFAATPAMASGPGGLPGGPGGLPGGPGSGTGITWMSQPNAVGDLTVGDTVDSYLMAAGAVSYAAADASVADLGLNVDSTGHLTGTVADVPGAYAFTVTASDGAEGTSDQTFTGTVTRVEAPDYHPVWLSLTEPSGTVGSPYYFQLEATNWNGSMSVEENDGSFNFPPGLNLDVERKAIFGTPTKAGDYTFTLVAVGPDWTLRTPHTFTIHIAEAQPEDPWMSETFTFEQGAQAHELINVPGATNVTFGSDSDTYDLSIVKQGGKFYLDGLFTTYGGWGITLNATVGGQQYEKTLYGTALQGLPNFPREQTEFTGTARVGEEYSAAIVANYEETLTLEGTLPAGLTFKYKHGVGMITGTPTKVGNVSFNVIASNTRYPAAGETRVFNGFSINVKKGKPVVDGYALGNLTAGQKINHTFTGTNVDFWQTDGTLPAGLTFNRETATLSGTVEYGDEAYGGYYDFAVIGSQEKTDDTDEQVYRGTVTRHHDGGKSNPVITTTTRDLGKMQQGVPYSKQLTSDKDVQWEVSSGDLPAGITLSKSGVLSGTPTKYGLYDFTVTAFNDEGSMAKRFGVAVRPPVSVNPPGGMEEGTTNAGATITVSGSGFAPDSDVTVVLRSNPVTLGSFTADSDGKVEASVTIPLNTPAGTHHLYFVDEDGVEYLISEITVAAAGDSTDVIPGLGFEGAPFLGVAALMLLGGAALMVRRRKVAAE
ncbi:Ig domain-containing protein [Leifsonia sp. Leaf264]|uniref:Ig domain-containing protein n=1 Tax=Leifsonia sp. Leaf264 TaxID=1736314 RepID=UPI0006F318C2|nr:putative Ig domain-containing protein [Leifsonia sp. Leaf264]KQO98318.1 hypothetical protein ASF30_09670 [Leifsonia sp. Leaf264]